MANIINLIAAIITIGLFIVSVINNNVLTTEATTFTSIPINSTPLKIALFVLLEMAFATFIAWCIYNLNASIDAGIAILLKGLIYLFSAWTSIYTTQWVFTGTSISGLSNILMFFGLLCFAHAVAIITISQLVASKEYTAALADKYDPFAPPTKSKRDNRKEHLQREVFYFHGAILFLLAIYILWSQQTG